MPGKVLLYVMAGLAVGALFVLSLIRGHPPHNASQWLSPIGLAVTVAGIGLWIFDRYAWRWPLVSRVVGRPVLHGTWHGALLSDWVNPQTQERIPPIPDVFLVVRQRYWQVSIRLLTGESESASMTANFVVGSDGVHRLVWLYANTPRTEVRHRSELHHGAAMLSAPRDRTQGLEGQYFTDRKTRGELRFNRHYKQLIEAHRAGRALVDADGAGS